MVSASSSDDEIDRRSERFDSYSNLSADVSEAESGSSTSTFSPHPHPVPPCSSTYSSSSSSLIRANFSDPSDFPDFPSVMLTVVGGIHGDSPPDKPEKSELSEIELMKERFAKLLLGEDMSGGAKGVCTALAISNAITNLSATVFGEMWKLEPLPPQKKSMWYREMEWLLCVSDSIVELVPSVKPFPGGGTFEVMVARPRSDLSANLPALRKLDTMLVGMLDGFHDSEFYYIDRGVVTSGGEHFEETPRSPSFGRPSTKLEEKWWLPFPKVPRNGLSEDTRKKLLQYRECTNQIFKAAVAINDSVLSEMAVPNVYLESLPKSAKDCLGEILYRHFAADDIFPEHLLDYLNLSSEYTIREVMNKIEMAVNIWRQKYLKRKFNCSKAKRSAWGGTVKGLGGESEKSKHLAQRAETLLQHLKMCFPGLPQTTLDMNKIQYNKDVGHSILESYSRVLESLAFNLMARFDDLLYVDDATKRRAAAESMSKLGWSGLACTPSSRKQVLPCPLSIKKPTSSLNKSSLN